MMGIVWLTYELAKHWFNENTALLSALIISLSPIFFYLSFHQYTEIPSVFFSLLGLYLLIKKRAFLCGIALSLAFLSKFPSGIFLIITGLFLLYRREWKEAMLVSLGFASFALPYFLWSFTQYGGLFATLLAAQDAINRAAGCNVLRYREWWHYGYWLIFSMSTNRTCPMSSMAM